MYELVREEKTQTEKYERWVEDEVFVDTLAGVPLVGLFYGVLLGPILGALWRPNIGMIASAFASAALGLLMGPVLLSALAGMTVACVYRPERRLPLRVRLSRRGLLAISSLLVVPAMWYSLKSAAQGGRRFAKSRYASRRARDSRGFPPFAFATVMIDLVLVQAVAFGRPLRALHYTFLIVGFLSTGVIIALAFSKSSPVPGSL